MPIILSTRRKSQFNVFTFRNGQLISIVVVLFICSVDKKAYPLQNVQNSPLFYSQFFKLFYSSRWTLGSFCECMCFFSNCVSISILCLCLNNIYILVCPCYFYIHCVSLILLCPCFYSVFVHVTFFIHFVCLILLCPCFYVAFLLNNQCFYSISAFS